LESIARGVLPEDKAGAVAYLMKPFSKYMLLDAVGRCSRQIGSNQINDRQDQQIYNWL